MRALGSARPGYRGQNHLKLFSSSWLRPRGCGLPARMDVNRTAKKNPPTSLLAGSIQHPVIACFHRGTSTGKLAAGQTPYVLPTRISARSSQKSSHSCRSVIAQSYFWPNQHACRNGRSILTIRLDSFQSGARLRLAEYSCSSLPRTYARTHRLPCRLARFSAGA